MLITIKALMVLLFAVAFICSAIVAFIFFRLHSITLLEVQALRAEVAAVKTKAEDLYKESELVRFLKALRDGGPTQ